MRKRQKCYALRTFPNFFTYTSAEAFSHLVHFYYTLRIISVLHRAAGVGTRNRVLEDLTVAQPFQWFPCLLRCNIVLKYSLRTVMNQKNSVHTVASLPPLTFLLILSYQGLPYLIYHLRATCNVLCAPAVSYYLTATQWVQFRVPPTSCKFHMFFLQ